MPFTSEAVVAHWSSPRNIIFLSPCGGLDPWQHQEHPRSHGVSNEIALSGVFINTEIQPAETTYPSAPISSQRAVLCAIAWDLWSLRIASFLGNEGRSLPALWCISGHLLRRPKQRRACWSKLGLIRAVQGMNASLQQQGSPANGPWLTDYHSIWVIDCSFSFNTFCIESNQPSSVLEMNWLSQLNSKDISPTAAT